MANQIEAAAIVRALRAARKKKPTLELEDLRVAEEAGRLLAASSEQEEDLEFYRAVAKQHLQETQKKVQLKEKWSNQN